MRPREEFSIQLIASLKQLRAFARSLCGNAAHADDLVQETVLRAWKNRDQFEAGTTLSAWLFTILRNRYRSELRHRKFEASDAEGELAGEVAVDGDQETSMELTELHKALQRLPLEQREALVLVGAAGLSYEHAAKICGCAVGTLKSRIARARDKLTEEIGSPDTARSRKILGRKN